MHTTAIESGKDWHHVSRDWHPWQYFGETRMWFEGKCGVVTGGASGIGRAVVARLVKEGAQVVLADLGQSEIDRVVAEFGGNVRGIAADISTEGGVQAIMALALADRRRLDFVHHNAGVSGPVCLIEEASVEGFDRTFAVNTRGTFLVLKASILQMKKQGGGSIVVTSSIQGERHAPRLGVYVASKHAINGLVRAAGAECAPFNIRINALMPGPTDTPMLHDVAALMVGGSAGAGNMVEQWSKAAPIGRLSRPEEQAACVAWMLSDEASYLVGHAMAFDGGVLC
jgi:NAD(P)-dependent dehydrogenase (short-subunit alcohol dehydrogenase family)